MTILPLTTDLENDFEMLFLPYFQELEEGEEQPLPPHVIKEKLLPFILNQWGKGIIHIDLCLTESAAGFAIYQIDAPESDWCKRPGWGFIREFYVTPALRRLGVGRRMAGHAIHRLRALGASQIYLTSDSAVAFWTCCGFSDETHNTEGTHILTMTL